MIGKIIRGDDFRGLMAYLTAARKQLTADHVEARHIVNLDLAAPEMAAVAAAATHLNRLKKPVAHIVLGWKSAEAPTPDQQKVAAGRVLEKLGLTSHQAVIVVHDEAKGGIKPGLEGRHFETHISVNRVRFDGGVAKLDHDFAQLERACAEIALEMGFIQVAGRFNGGRAALTKPGVGNRIGSIAAQNGRPTLAQELRDSRRTIQALRDARTQGWMPLLHAFRDHGVTIVPGRVRRGDLKRGLVMVDANEPKRKIKISALDAPAEKWSSIALERELGPMPDGWQTSFGASTNKSVDLPSELNDVPEAEKPRGLDPEYSTRPNDLASAIISDPDRLASLRAARADGWTALIAEFARQGIRIESGWNARRGAESGLIMVDVDDPTRSVKLSALDSPTEKWGAGALARELGPWPGLTVSPQPFAKAQAARPPGVATKFTQPDEVFDRSGAYTKYISVKESTVTHNRLLNAPQKLDKAGLFERQRREKDRHYALRRLRREVVRGIFGRRSVTGKLINAAADLLFDRRMEMVTRAQRQERRVMTAEHSARRRAIPLWPDFLRAVRRDHAQRVERQRREEQEAIWLLSVRQRRDRLKGCAEAKTRLAHARKGADARLMGRYELEIRYLCFGGILSDAEVLRELRAGDGQASQPQAQRRLPNVIVAVRDRFRHDEVRSWRDRLDQTSASFDALVRARVTIDVTAEVVQLVTSRKAPPPVRVQCAAEIGASGSKGTEQRDTRIRRARRMHKGRRRKGWDHALGVVEKRRKEPRRRGKTRDGPVRARGEKAYKIAFTWKRSADETTATRRRARRWLTWSARLAATVRGAEARKLQRLEASRNQALVRKKLSAGLDLARRLMADRPDLIEGLFAATPTQESVQPVPRTAAATTSPTNEISADPTPGIRPSGVPSDPAPRTPARMPPSPNLSTLDGEAENDSDKKPIEVPPDIPGTEPAQQPDLPKGSDKRKETPRLPGRIKKPRDSGWSR